MKQYNVAIVGTGAVGTTLLQILEERDFPTKNLKLLATERSAGKKLNFKGKEYVIEKTTNESFDGVDIALFAGGAASKLYAKEAVSRGTIVIDNSSAFRLDPEVPLVVPEVNPEDVKEHKGIIANPNCSTIQMVVALKPLHDYAKINRIVVSTYQAVSGAGQEAMDELEMQSKKYLNDEKIEAEIFQHQIAFNLIPHIDVFMDNNYTKEEMKMVNETQKMFHDDNIKISATTVRVPIMRSHSEAINIETEKELTPEKAKELLMNAPGVIVKDDPKSNCYPMPKDSSDKDEVLVGRIRKDISCENGLCLFIAADQLRKGAATNAVQIAELLIKYDLA